jgi:hypothetical protein
MRNLRLLVAALLGILVLGALAASAASAAEASALFTYSGNGTFIITGKESFTETTARIQFECAASEGAGQFGRSQARTVELTITFTDCTIVGGEIGCTSSGLPGGDVQTVPLQGTLGRIKPGAAGILLKPLAGKQFLLPTKCATITLEWTGSVIGKLKAVDKQTKALTAAFKQEHGLQEIKTFELGVKEADSLVSGISGHPEQMGLESEETLTLLSGSGILLA